MGSECPLRLRDYARLAASRRALVDAVAPVIRLVAAGASVVLFVPAQSPGQELGTLTGTVITADVRPVASAQVRIVSAEEVVLTGVNGEFRLANLPPGIHTLEIRMLGYSRLLLPVEIESGQTRTVGVTLVVEPVALQPVEITAESAPSPALRGFYERRTRGAGHFFTREEIARMHPRAVTDVLRRVPGVQIQPAPGPYGASSHVRMGRATGGLGARPCPVLFYVNGSPFPVTADLAINHFIAADDIEAIEVYTGTSRIPPQFSSNMHNARCGVVVIWTQIGTHGRKAP